MPSGASPAGRWAAAWPRPADLRALLGEAPPDGLGLVHRPYPRSQLLALLEAFVVQDAAETDLAHPLDSRPTRHF